MPGRPGPSAGGERGLCEALAAEAAAEVGRLAAAVACGLAAVSLRRLQARLRAQRRRAGRGRRDDVAGTGKMSARTVAAVPLPLAPSWRASWPGSR